MTDPMIEASTTVVRPAERAKMVIISSAAVPKVALMMPPIWGPAKWPTLSVACPRTQANLRGPKRSVRRRVGPGRR